MAYALRFDARAMRTPFFCNSSEGAIRAAVAATVTGLVLGGVASIAYAQSWVQPPLCSPSQVGMPCNSNMYDMCLPTLCWQIADAGMGVYVPVSCTQCTACVQADCRAVGCPYGGVCTYQGTPQTPCGGSGYDNDKTAISNPSFVCNMDGGAPVPETPPTCPDLTGWTDLCGGGPQPGGAKTPGGGGADSGSTGVNAGAGAPPSGSSSGLGSSVPAGDPGGAAAGGSTGPGATVAPPAGTVEAGSPPRSHYDEYVYGPRACAIGRGALTTGSGGAWSVAFALGLLIMRRKAAPPS